MLSPDRTLEHELGDLVESPTIVPVQFFGPVRGWRDLAGEYRLMIAILEDAIDICCRPPWRRCSGRRLLRETEAWLESTDCSWVFSFERICEALNLDPDSVRQRIRTHRQHAVVRALRTLRERQRPLHGAGGLPEGVCGTIPASVSPETAGDSYLPEEVPAA